MPEAVIDEQTYDDARAICQKYFRRTLSDGNIERLLKSMDLVELDSILGNLAAEKNVLPTVMHIYAERKRIRMEKEERERRDARNYDQTEDERLAIWWYTLHCREIAASGPGLKRIEDQRKFDKWFLATVAGIRIKHGQHKFARTNSLIRGQAEHTLNHYEEVIQGIEALVSKASPEWRGRIREGVRIKTPDPIQED